jgi:hypothetical protein
MSRGFGAVQRRILDDLKRNTNDPLDDFANGYRSWTTVQDLACPGDFTEPTRAQVEATRRAVLKLEAAGLVDVLCVRRRVTSRYVASYGIPWADVTKEYRVTEANRMLLAARLSLSPEHEQAYRAAADKRQRERAAFDAALLKKHGLR